VDLLKAVRESCLREVSSGVQERCELPVGGGWNSSSEYFSVDQKTAGKRDSTNAVSRHALIQYFNQKLSQCDISFTFESHVLVVMLPFCAFGHHHFILSSVKSIDVIKRRNVNFEV